MAQQRAVQRALARAAPLQRPHEALQRLHARHLQPAAAGHGVVPRRRARPQRQPRLAARGRRGRAAAAALAAVPGRGLDRVAARARRRARGKLHEQPRTAHASSQRLRGAGRNRHVTPISDVGHSHNNALM